MNKSNSRSGEAAARNETGNAGNGFARKRPNDAKTSSGRRRPAAAPGSGIPIPKEHGAWAVLYAPIVTAVLVAGQVNFRLLWFLLAVTGLFLAHEPLARLARAGWPLSGMSGRVASWWRWAALDLGVVGLAGIVLWLVFGLSDLPVLGVATAALLALHLYRVTRRNERSVTGEVIGIAGLTLTLPGALHVLLGGWSLESAWLWLLHFIYFAGGIFYVKARVCGFVGRPEAPGWMLASDLYHIGAVLATGLAGAAGWFSPWVSVAFIPALARALWGTRLSPGKLVMRRIGYSEVGLTLLFVASVAAAWSAA